MNLHRRGADAIAVANGGNKMKCSWTSVRIKLAVGEDVNMSVGLATRWTTFHLELKSNDALGNLQIQAQQLSWIFWAWISMFSFLSKCWIAVFFAGMTSNFEEV